jgi:hypothetical protein
MGAYGLYKFGAQIACFGPGQAYGARICLRIDRLVRPRARSDRKQPVRNPIFPV